ncbi:hypothetical protein [Kribbella deserti]|uniref:Uncharacterized protein n=1 Tax=Kribbella deserti TaxID=1926257 RepID=A0ABV6QXY8_9ACTN
MPACVRTPGRHRPALFTLVSAYGFPGVLGTAISMGFESSVLRTEELKADGEEQVRAEMRFRGRSPLPELVVALGELDGVRAVRANQDNEE